MFGGNINKSLVSRLFLFHGVDHNIGHGIGHKVTVCIMSRYTVVNNQ